MLKVYDPNKDYLAWASQRMMELDERGKGKGSVKRPKKDIIDYASENILTPLLRNTIGALARKLGIFPNGQ